MTLLFFGMQNKEERKELFKVLAENTENPFRRACIDSFKTFIDGWQESQNAWRKWAETNQRLVEEREETKKMWQESQNAWRKWEETNQRLVEKDKEMQGKLNELTQQMLNSRSFRLGRALTWPLRKLLGRK